MSRSMPDLRRCPWTVSGVFRRLAHAGWNPEEVVAIPVGGHGQAEHGLVADQWPGAERRVPEGVYPVVWLRVDGLYDRLPSAVVGRAPQVRSDGVFYEHTDPAGVAAAWFELFGARIHALGAAAERAIHLSRCPSEEAHWATVFSRSLGLPEAVIERPEWRTRWLRALPFLAPAAGTPGGLEDAVEVLLPASARVRFLDVEYAPPDVGSALGLRLGTGRLGRARRLLRARLLVELEVEAETARAFAQPGSDLARHLDAVLAWFAPLGVRVQRWLRLPGGGVALAKSAA